jgi:predicted nucleotidyltransferase
VSVFGLRDSDIAYIRSTLENEKEVEKAVVFGSRAMGNHKKASDVDIAIFGGNVNLGTALRIKGILDEESPIPFFFDVLNYTSISNPKLKEHIDTHGKEIFTRTSPFRQR